MKATDLSKLAREARDKSFDFEVRRIQSLLYESAKKGDTSIAISVNENIVGRIKNHFIDLGFDVSYNSGYGHLNISWS